MYLSIEKRIEYYSDDIERWEKYLSKLENGDPLVEELVYKLKEAVDHLKKELTNRSEAYFIEHCDDHLCDLGTFEFDCPACTKHVTDYEIWWLNDDLYKGLKHTFKCEHCGVELRVERDFNDHCCYVYKKE